VLVDNARGLSRQIIERHKLNKSNLIVEIGSNDGYLLQFYKEAGLRVLGVDAAMNVAKVAVEQRGIPTKVGFFDESIAKTILCQEGRARIIHANNVLAHTASLHSVIAGISMLLEDSGIGVFEFAYAPDMVKTGAFDLIYHEHLCYYSLETFDKLLRLHDLAAFDVEHIDTHGGSLRVYASRPQAFPSSRRLLALRKEEQADGIDTESFYSGFAESVRELKSRVTQFLSELESQGKRVAAYGAAAKATVMLNYFEITNRQIPFLADRSPHKQGLFIPGADIPICHPDRIIKDKPDYLLISAWNLKDEIIWQMKHVREWGGRFLVFLPKIEIIP
jgi:SAM-dependent methyltransferase